ncbi:MAG TPA: DNA (cytosine-5-)-methyltransferase [Allosphingosinicella sp.]|nr:DNA (cytosine-5-)-methyltransferase [Allosphingosinicella sp.]
MTWKCGALFAGIGGFCLGFREAGIKTSWAVENDAHAATTYCENFPDTRLIAEDVKTISVKSHGLEAVDVLTAGFPCQSFSQAGTRQGFEDPRGELFYEIIRLIEEFGSNRPKVLVLENAPFLQYGEGGTWFMRVSNAIRKAGYWFKPDSSCVLDTYELTELPQQRQRLFMVALSTEFFRSGRFQFPSDPYMGQKELSRYVDFEGEYDGEYYLDKKNKYFSMISKAVRDRSCLYQLRKYEVRAKEPNTCPTLTANMGLGGHNVPFLMNGVGLRKLTEHECLRLQGFPTTFQFPETVPRAHRYKQVGNAVAVPLVKLLAERVRQRLDSERPS